MRGHHLCPASLCCCHYCGLPNLSEAASAPRLSSLSGLGPLAPPSLSSRWSPTLCLGPLIRNGWGAPSWGREGAGRGDREREGEALQRQSLPTCPPPAQRRACCWTSPASHLRRREGGMKKGPCTARSQGPGCRDQVPGLGGEPGPERLCWEEGPTRNLGMQ